ncbi:MAG: hypothetical protein R3Y39_00805 [Rikenellaceae bacterium]
MVAITSRFRYLGLTIVSLLFAALFSLSAHSATSGVTARITALEGDSTYMSMLSREVALQNREDSLSQLLVKYRNEFAAGGAQASQARNSIVDIEMELFDVRAEYNTISGEVTTIEEQWILNNPSTNNDGSTPNSTNNTLRGDISKSIATSKLASENLPKEDYDNLRLAESIEAKCAAAYTEYIETYERMRELLQLYNQTDDEEIANEYSTEFHTLKRDADSLSKILRDDWGAAYDNKDFAYNMLMEVMGYDDLLNQSGEMARECESEIAAIECGPQSGAAVRYNLQKQKMVRLEGMFANKLQLTNAVDSLSGAAKKLSYLAPLEELPELVFVKRNFILYEPILFSTTPVYDNANPIPETVIYPKGTIYRIHYGAFNSKQAPSIFHGAYPLSYSREGGLWTYYGGGFETFAEADEAAALCKRQGFRRPEVVIWRDGVKRNLYRDPFPADQKYRVQISGLIELTDDIKNIISTHCPDAELSKVGADRYVIGPLEGQIVVEEFAQALEFANGALNTTIIEIE